MPADWTIKSGDTQPSFADTLKYSDGTVPPLQGATLTLRLRSLANASLTIPAGLASIVNPNTGDVLFTPTAADTATPGNYFAEWFVTFAVGTGLGVQTFPTDGFNWVAIEPNVGALAQQIIDLGDVKKYLNISDRTRDFELTNLIAAVTPLIEQEIGPTVPRNYEEWFDGGSNIKDLGRQPSSGFGSSPLLQVIAASEYRGPIEYPLALVASPTFGSIYSIFVDVDMGTITRRTAGGRTIAFMPGRQSVHVFYKTGQSPIPPNAQRAALEAVRVGYRWPQQIGRGSLSPADQMDVGAALSAELTRVIRIWTKPTKRFPSIA